MQWNLHSWFSVSDGLPKCQKEKIYLKKIYIILWTLTIHFYFWRIRGWAKTSFNFWLFSAKIFASNYPTRKMKKHSPQNSYINNKSAIWEISNIKTFNCINYCLRAKRSWILGLRAHILVSISILLFTYWLNYEFQHS